MLGLGFRRLGSGGGFEIDDMAPECVPIRVGRPRHPKALILLAVNSTFQLLGVDSQSFNLYFLGLWASE